MSALYILKFYDNGTLWREILSEQLNLAYIIVYDVFV